MTSTLAIVLNLALDIAILSTLAYVMTRAGRLTPHRSAAASDRTVTPARRTGRFDRQRVASELEPAID